MFRIFRNNNFIWVLIIRNEGNDDGIGVWKLVFFRLVFGKDCFYVRFNLIGILKFLPCFLQHALLIFDLVIVVV